MHQSKNSYKPGGQGMLITNINISSKERHFISIKENERGAKYLSCDGFNQQIKLGNSYVDKSDADYVPELEVTLSEENFPLRVATFEMGYNFVSSNGLNLNPAFVEYNNGEEIRGASDVIILTYGSDFKYLRSILGNEAEIVNTFHNKDGAHGCIITYPHAFIGSILKSESRGSENDFWHLGVEVDENHNVTIINNKIKKPETVTELARIAEKKRRTGIMASTKRVLPQSIICLNKDRDECVKYIEDCASNNYFKQYNMYILPDDVVEGNKIPKEILDFITSGRIRAALLWDMNDVPYEVIKDLHLLYIFTAGKTKSVKCTKSN